MVGQKVIGVLLAAGEGRRLGRGAKALVEFSGQPQAIQAARALKDGGCDEILVVVGAQSDEVTKALEGEDCRAVFNPLWRTGMGSSFQIGVENAHQRLERDYGGRVVISLVDQPDVGAEVIARLIRRATHPERVFAAGYPNDQGEVVRGHPIIFPAAMAREAADLAAGDAAGREWVKRHRHLVELVDMTGLATGRDIDTPTDWIDWNTG